MSNARKTGKNPESKSGRHSTQAAVPGKSTAAANSVALPRGEAAIPSIQIPAAIDISLYYRPGGPDPSGQGMTGAQIFANLCKEEGLLAMFCAAGNYHIVNAIAEAGIPCYGGRTEGGMCAAADGFARVTGEVVACSGTEGPGLAHMIMNIASAHFSNSALLVLASNSLLRSEDTQTWIQFIFQQPLTEGLKKYGKRITVPNRIYEYGAYAFRNLKSGVPDVVHLDFPAEVAVERFPDVSRLQRAYRKEQYRTESRAYPGTREVRQAIEMINKAERPVLIAGHGIFVRKACDALMQAAEKHEMAVVGSGPVRGHFPDDHRLSGSMSNEALMNADLVVFVGQYSMPSPEEWTLPPGVKTIRVHPEQGDLGRNWPLDLGIVSDEKVFMEALANGLPAKKRDSWVREIAAARSKWEKTQMELYSQFLKHSRDTNRLHPFVLSKEVHDFLYRGDIDPKQTVTGWGGNMIGFGCMRWLRANRPGQEVTVVYQFGPMGPDLAMMMGPAVAVQRGIGPHAPYKGAPVVVVTGDAGMAYSLLELDTFVKYKLPVICVVYNNDCWGTFTLSTSTPQALHVYMFQENLRYDKMAEHLGVRGEYVCTPEELRVALTRSYDAAEKQGYSTLINCQGIKEFNLAEAYPPGLDFAPEPGIGAIRH
jgi:thiamine pyrophosphate-dependent acetolactate synthase large subunit-like protein